jgi:hypothetical protein
MGAVVLALGALTLLFGERIGINDGQGWDGTNYMHWSDEFWHRVVEYGVTKYQAQRVLASALVWCMLHPLGIKPTVANHLVGFELLDLAALALAAVIWAHLALRVMRWRAAAAWAGFVALFGCFANARHALYDPVLLDPLAFALGMVTVWGYLARRSAAVWIAGLLGVVTWPPLPPIAVAMLVLRRPSAPVPELAARWPRWVAAAGAAAGAALVLNMMRYYYAHPVEGVGDEKLVVWVIEPLLIVTVPLAIAQLLVGWFLVVRERRLWNVPAYLRELSPRHLVVALAGAVAIYVARAQWISLVGTQPGGPNADQFLCEYSLEILRGPVWGVVHHVVYYGPIVLVALLSWRRVCAIAGEWGPAASFGVAMIVWFSVASESRQWIHLLPLLVALAIAATRDLWTPRRTLAFAALALPWSKLWFVIGFDHVNGHHNYPDQRYLMHHGPYASNAMYATHLAAAVITGLILTFAARRASRQQATGSGLAGLTGLGSSRSP